MESARDYLFRISVCPGNFSPHVRESKTLLDSGFHVVDSGFHLLDSRSFSVELGFRIRIVSGIPDSYTCIPDSKAQDSGFQMQKFPGFWNPDSFTWGEIFQWDEPEIVYPLHPNWNFREFVVNGKQPWNPPL